MNPTCRFKLTECSNDIWTCPHCGTHLCSVHAFAPKHYQPSCPQCDPQTDCDYCGEKFDATKPHFKCKAGPFAGEQYCSRQCKSEATQPAASDDGRIEREQMGLTSL